uniref:CSON001850 protein n=1 Tax=Culicoides sonorensis TaxID=179676 RepID=A0A336MIX7_CULSO
MLLICSFKYSSSSSPSKTLTLISLSLILILPSSIFSTIPLAHPSSLNRTNPEVCPFSNSMNAIVFVPITSANASRIISRVASGSKPSRPIIAPFGRSILSFSSSSLAASFFFLCAFRSSRFSSL